jgi:NitT/TauT family transport system substrate-binding protein
MTLPTFKPDIDKTSVEKLNQLLVTEGLLTAPADLTKLLP